MKNIEHFIEKILIDGKQWYRCKWQNCAYSTIRSDSIVRHMRKHTGERPYKCWFCSYATIQNSALKIHMRRHTGEKPYVCKFPDCGKRFAVLNTLVVHERTHTGYKPYKCSFGNGCQYSSSDRCKLYINHFNAGTDQNDVDVENVSREENSIKRVMNYVDKRSIGNRTSYYCKWANCGYESLRSDSIVRHIRSHTGERPYKCHYLNCNYATIQRSSLNKHMTKHISSL
ncbi:zinc finger domain-containing protein 13 [Sarcoptes scabiei]|uniref:Zinc finger domain-containing protein 13 n=1 Tax=Sarcoptes scabiei TaxID=52283 RepID=A0A132A5W0_SARSC|nr:zinc finger domain-containing protein 13 [Sarcoptes scabiei]